MIGRMDADPRAWRPQAFGHRPVKDVADPVIEPAWDGVRVLVHLDTAAANVAIHDATGADLTPDHAPIAEALLAALAAETAVVDGYLTDQATQPSESRTILNSEIPSFSEHASQFFLGRRGAELMSASAGLERTGRSRIPAPDEGDSEEAPIAFVAVDLLSIDGSSLIDVPLLERKRLLDGALKIGEMVRITPYVRPPIGSFALTWRALGFRELAFKRANGRYCPTGEPSDWGVESIPSH